MSEQIKYEKELKIIRNYLTLNPDTPKYKVSAVTKISLDIIIELIEEGFLAEEEGDLKLSRRGHIKNDERKSLIERLRKDVTNKEMDTQEEQKNPEKSQLLIDLSNKKSAKWIDEDFER